MNYIEKFIKSSFSIDKNVVTDCFLHYDKNRDGFLDAHEFEVFLNDTFSDSGGTNNIQYEMAAAILKQLDEDQDNKLSKSEFYKSWRYWLKYVLNPVTALLVIDVQNDFINGSLALNGYPAGHDGYDVIPVINKMLGEIPFDVVMYSKDWHPPNHISFGENVKLRPLHETSKVSSDDAKVGDTVVFRGPPITEQCLWPTHCVQNSKGAEIHCDLKIVEGSYVVNKGTNPEVDSYSAFWDNNKLSQTELVNLLSKHHVTDVYVCGLAYDVCVGFTALHSVEHGFRTVFIEDACRGVTQEGMEKMSDNLKGNGIVIAQSNEVKNLVEARHRNLQLGLQAAKNMALGREMAQSRPSVI
ncbi:nicotinamidase-like [Gigantopelta aegis]|uniref:nicotinamidase-like n=1 Tax=Gigantopelta aegis TaxID=1735272 RepID=UPI001B889DBC|nr:nicotinamidase-like [Gigantopelta aegis]